MVHVFIFINALNAWYEILSTDIFSPVTLSSSVHGIHQTKMLEWVAIFFSKGFSWPRDYKGFHCSSVGKESACNAEDLGLIPRSGRLPGEEYL